MNILIVDDSQIVRERLYEMLVDCRGIETISQASDGIEAIDTISRTQPDIIVMDIHMPRKNGIEVLKELSRTQHTFNDTGMYRRPLFIILTNYPYPQFKQKCMKLGADFFFDKSCEFEKVSGVIEHHIQTHVGKS